MTTHEAADDIAIVGLSFRLPTDISSDDAFWEMLQEGRSASGAVPDDRFSLERYWHPSPDRHGTVRRPKINDYYLADDFRPLPRRLISSIEMLLHLMRHSFP
jgi:acyl transferase domain-containing protein